MYLNILRLTMVLAFTVVVLGAYTRLSDAGLGCPDWPGCYGNITVPESQVRIDNSNETYASRPLEQAKAWKEMIHRYAAGTLGFLIFILAFLSWKNPARGGQRVLPLILTVLVIIQALLGMWTVTLLLKPIIVMGHLLGGMTILLLLVWSYMKQNYRVTAADVRRIKPLYAWAVLCLGVVFIQVSLGGWTGANYAALICPDFPLCQGQWWPPMDFRDGFIPWRGLGTNYEFGVLGPEARTAVHYSHRLGALFTLIIVGAVSIKAMRGNDRNIRRAGGVVLAVLIIQFCLGVSNILMTLPIGVAVAHNAVAAILLVSTGALLFHSKYFVT